MGEDTESGHPDEATACSWCGAPLRDGETERGRVCERCVRRMRAEGLSDEEIFAPSEDT